MLKVVTKIHKECFFLFVYSFRFQSVSSNKHIKVLNIYLDITNVFPVFGIFYVNFGNSFNNYHFIKHEFNIIMVKFLKQS